MEDENNQCCSRVAPSEVATSRQNEYLVKYIETGSVFETSQHFCVRQDTVRDALRVVAAKAGLSTIKKLLPKEKRSTRKSEINAKALLQLLEKQNYRCALSGVVLNPDDCSLDHIVPVSEGGTDHIDNLQWVSREINRSKGCMDNNEFILMCKRVAAWSR